MIDAQVQMTFLQQVREAIEGDTRFIGMINNDVYNETSAGQIVDVAKADIGSSGHPYIFYEMNSFILKTDIRFYSESEMEFMLQWLSDSLTFSTMVWCDKTGGHLTVQVKTLIDQLLHSRHKLILLQDESVVFKNVSIGFWHSLLYTFYSLQIDQPLFARDIFNQLVIENLLRLLRLEANRTNWWNASYESLGSEYWLKPERLVQLRACLPPINMTSFKQSFNKTAELGIEVCEVIATSHNWTWPRELAEQIVRFVNNFTTQGQP